MPPDFQDAHFKTFVWTLVDSDEARDGIPPLLIPHGTRLYVTYVTSPASDRWSRMEKTVSLTVAVMNPWTKREIHRA
jgi:hypothetical protein